MNTEWKRQIEAFHRLHGPECFSEGTVLYYKTGAFRETSPPGVLAPPPKGDTVEGEHELALAKLKFYRLKLEAAVRAFDEMNSFLAYSSPIEPEAELLRLKARKAAVDYARKLHRQAEAAVANTRRGKANAAAELEREMDRERFSAFQRKRQSIRI